MQRRMLGSSGFEISTIGLGSWAIGGHMWGGQDDAQSAEAFMRPSITVSTGWTRRQSTAPGIRRKSSAVP